MSDEDEGRLLQRVDDLAARVDVLERDRPATPSLPRTPEAEIERIEAKARRVQARIDSGMPPAERAAALLAEPRTGQAAPSSQWTVHLAEVEGLLRRALFEAGNLHAGHEPMCPVAPGAKVVNGKTLMGTAKDIAECTCWVLEAMHLLKMATPCSPGTPPPRPTHPTPPEAPKCPSCGRFAHYMQTFEHEPGNFVHVRMCGSQVCEKNIQEQRSPARCGFPWRGDASCGLPRDHAGSHTADPCPTKAEVVPHPVWCTLSLGHDGECWPDPSRANERVNDRLVGHLRDLLGRAVEHLEAVPQRHRPGQQALSVLKAGLRLAEPEACTDYALPEKAKCADCGEPEQIEAMVCRTCQGANLASRGGNARRDAIEECARFLEDVNLRPGTPTQWAAHLRMLADQRSETALLPNETTGGNAKKGT